MSPEMTVAEVYEKGGHVWVIVHETTHSRSLLNKATLGLLGKRKKHERDRLYCSEQGLTWYTYPGFKAVEINCPEDKLLTRAFSDYWWRKKTTGVEPARRNEL